MSVRRGVIEASALLGAAGTFWYFRLRDTPTDSTAANRSAATGGALNARTPPRSPDGTPLQLVCVQVAFRHGARMPNYDVLHPREVATTGPAAWTAEHTDWDQAVKGAPFVLRDYKGNDLAGGASNERILNSSRKLGGGATAGQLSVLGWQQMVDFGRGLNRRYLGPPGPTSLMKPGEQSLPPSALLTRC